ncbi:MAG: LPXTG cell wall anchor domain-containing protein [Jatrophihabitantaceae bacterium]
MRRLRTAVVLAIAVLGMLLLTAGPAAADVEEAISSLRSSNLYVDRTAGAKLDQDEAGSALNSKIKIAVLPTGSGDAGQLAARIGQDVDTGGKLTVGVFVGRNFNAASSELCAGRASQLASRAVEANRSQLRSGSDLTETIKDFADLVDAAPKGCSNGSGGSGGDDSEQTQSTGGSGWATLGVLGVLGAGGVGALMWRRRRKDRQALADARALIQPFYDRLAADVASLQPGDNATARQALADASERYNSGGSQLATATTLAQLGGARRSILEGLQAARTARQALGLDLGPELPPLAESNAPQLSQAQQVDVGGQRVQGYPDYTPGAPYYFAGGGGYPGGWYSMPFWQTLLIAEALTPGWGFGFGGWGGGWGGYGYGSGYDSGFEAGRESTEHDSGGWGGGGGGGDWGGGGGDWGGGGGGGGDSGGGSW